MKMILIKASVNAPQFSLNLTNLIPAVCNRNEEHGQLKQRVIFISFPVAVLRYRLLVLQHSRYNHLCSSGGCFQCFSVVFYVSLCACKLLCFLCCLFGFNILFFRGSFFIQFDLIACVLVV